VATTRNIQRERLERGEADAAVNSLVSHKALRRIAEPDTASRELLRLAVEHLGISARGYVKLLRIARSLADLEGVDAVARRHFEEALALRSLDHQPVGLQRAG
jgi:magnesium chelatase family protein